MIFLKDFLKYFHCFYPWQRISASCLSTGLRLFGFLFCTTYGWISH